MDNEATLRLLRSIDRRLALLTVVQERDLRHRLASDLLRTEARVAMFDALDGTLTSPELARTVGVSERAVQMFVKELLDAGLARPTGKTGRGHLVERDEDAIVQWYLQRTRAE